MTLKSHIENGMIRFSYGLFPDRMTTARLIRPDGTVAREWLFTDRLNTRHDWAMVQRFATVLNHYDSNHIRRAEG